MRFHFAWRARLVFAQHHLRHGCRISLYVIDGGGITIDGGATVSGTGVTFYLTGANGNGSSAKNYSGVTINSTATVNLSSPCDGASRGIPGMLVFQDRSIT